MRCCSIFVCSGLLVFLSSGPVMPQVKTPEVDLQTVKYEALKQAVLKNRGKVVVVDFWGEY